MSLALALLLVYMVMACQYESLKDPFIVMFSVPLAAIGVVLMLFLTDTTFNIQSFIGCIMLGGIVVSNAILLVDHTSLLRKEEGMDAVGGDRGGGPAAPAADPDDRPDDDAGPAAAGAGAGRGRRGAGADGPGGDRRAAEFDADHAGVRAGDVLAVRGAIRAAAAGARARERPAKVPAA